MFAGIPTMGVCRMTKLFFSLIMMAGLILSVPSHAQNSPYGMQTGSDAFAACKAVDDEPGRRDSMLAMACLAWINGAVQAAEPTDWDSPQKPVYCTPRTGGSTGQYKDVFVNFLKANPAKRHLPAIYLFHQAMAEAFPCR